MKPAASPPSRRMGVDSSEKRLLFIDAAEALLRSEGYMAISARKVAARTGLKTQLLYYYFRTMDDLILAVVERINEGRARRLQEALASPSPLRSLWEMNADPDYAVMAAELTMIASHRDGLRAEIIRGSREFRAMQLQAVEALIGPRVGDKYPVAGIMMIAIGLARTLVGEAALDLTDGHAEAQAIVELILRDAESSNSRLTS